MTYEIDFFQFSCAVSITISSSKFFIISSSINLLFFQILILVYNFSCHKQVDLYNKNSLYRKFLKSCFVGQNLHFNKET